LSTVFTDHVSRKRFYIAMPPNFRPVFCKHFVAEWVNLALADARHASALETQIQATDSRE
jgi:hypothetical protein